MTSSAAARELVDAVKAGDESRVQALLDRDPRLAGARTEEGESPVLAAVYARSARLLEILLARFPELDLFEAAALGATARVGELLQAGPESARTWSADGWTPLHLAAFFGNGQAASALLDAGADVHARSRNALENTPLHAACAGDHPDLLELLLARGSDASATAAEWTPLHIAAGNGSRRAVQLLLAAGAPVDARGQGGRTALDLAKERGHADVADLLQSVTPASPA